jgi:type I restriction enzyme S subunit
MELVETGFKETEVGLIPLDWKVVELNSLGVFYKGKGIKKDEVQLDGIPCVRYGELYTIYNNCIRSIKSFISDEVAKNSFELKEGDILFAGSGETRTEIGKSASLLIKEKVFAGGDIVILRPKVGNSELLGYLLNASFIAKQKTVNGQGDAVVHIYSKGISKIKIPLAPTLKEQKAIATALSDVDALIHSLETLIAKKKAIKQGAMQELLTGKTRLAGFENDRGYQQTEVGLIPVDWVQYKVLDLIELLTDYDANGSFMSVAENVNVYNNENYAWYVRSTDLEKKSKLTDVRYVDEDSYRFLKKTSLYGGELLFLKRGDIGKVYLFKMRTRKATLAPNLYLLKLNEMSSSSYLYYFFNSIKGQLQLKSKNASSTLGALYKDDVKSILVPLPPSLIEQKAIAETLSSMDKDIQALQVKKEKYKRIKQGMMQELLTGKTRLI